MPDPLFWVVREDAGERTVFLQHASERIYAELKSGLAGHGTSKPVDVLQLDAKTARAIPKSVIGRTLSEREARALLKRIGG